MFEQYISMYRLKEFLNSKFELYNQPSFIKDDPISIPHLFTKKQDIEIAGFFASIFAWGNRKTIISKSRELMELMDMQPHEFCLNEDLGRLKRLLEFKHRTFNPTDLLYFVEFLQYHYRNNDSLETAFTKWGNTIEQMLIGFHHYFFSLEDVPLRTKKHIATPEKKSNCKRLNMFLRWMVRDDNKGVDFGLWKSINSSQLICPVDVHVARVAKRFNLLQRKQTDWNAAIELTEQLKKFDAHDPVKYDFALFGLGVIEKY
ncbi:TIGR02757 family protein [Parafilimonas terrae]|uniref:TIGR02757 family protein n=2 Tax=Parafilimonas terrae TaxID=1465490 RepID=A0A1I5WUA1_9BACT|nr:TIGR02757 family protein [Parafilimonas terrae]